MENLQKARYFLAKYQALSNASEFIRSHGEEGFSYEDKDFHKVYLREIEKLSKQLDKRAEDFAKKYNQMNIEIDTSTDENY